MPIIGQGGFGCVNEPSLRCKEKKSNAFYDKKISKLSLVKDAKKEFNSQIIVDTKVDPSFEFHLPPPTLCKPNVREERAELEKCKLVRNKTTGQLIPENDMALMIMPNGGEDLEKFTYNFVLTPDIYHDKTLPIEKNLYLHPTKFINYGTDKTLNKINVITQFWTNSMMLIDAISTFIQKKVTHNDLKPGNILYDHIQGRFNIIDFGHTRHFSKYKLPGSHFSYPPETYLKTPQIYNEVLRYDQSQFKEYLGIDPYDIKKSFIDSYQFFLVYVFPMSMFSEPHVSSLKFKTRKQIEKLIQVSTYKNHTLGEIRERCLATNDIYGLGLALMYVFARTYRYLGEWNDTSNEIMLNNSFIMKMYELLFSMIHPDPFKRIRIDELRVKYEETLKLLVPDYIKPAFSPANTLSPSALKNLQKFNENDSPIKTGRDSTSSSNAVPVPTALSPSTTKSVKKDDDTVNMDEPKLDMNAEIMPPENASVKVDAKLDAKEDAEQPIFTLDTEINPDLEIPHEQYNSFISSETCNSENESFRELNTHYIFVLDEDSQQRFKSSDMKEKDTHETLLVEQAHPPAKTSNEQTIIDRINKQIIALCNKKNIIIYVLLQNSSFKTNQFVSLFGKFIREDIPEKYYSNIIIINVFEADKVKLTDPLYAQYDSCKKYCLPNVIDKNTNAKRFFQILNVCCEKSHDGKLIRHTEKNKTYAYKFMQTTRLYDFKDVKDMILERKCSSGKLIQFTGTCWINAILNALILPKISRKYLLIQAKKNIEKDPANNKHPLYDLYYNRGKLSFENVLSSILYNIFIKKERPSDNKRELKNDFILTFADKIKRHCIAKYKDIPVIGAKKYKTNDVQFGVTGTFRTITYSLIEILKTYAKDYPHIYRVFTMRMPTRFTIKELASIRKPVLEKRIKKDKYNYRLTSCLISQNRGSHMICGFTCGDKEYIYNSNMRIAVECNWSKYDFTNYIDYYNNVMMEDYRRKGKKWRVRNLTIYITCLIYTVESEDDHKELASDEALAEGTFVPDFPCKLKKKYANLQTLRPATAKNTKRTNVVRKTVASCKKPNQELVNGKCLKMCKPDQIRNVTTNRCVNIVTSARRKTAKKR